MTDIGPLLLVGTTKGAFLLEGDADRAAWSVRGPFCDGWPINHMVGDARTGTIWAGGGGQWTGAGVWRSDDSGATWTLAKLNVDNAPNLSAQYGIQGIPAVKAFRNGKVVAQFVGAQPETGVRRWLSTLAPTAAERLLDQAATLEAKADWPGAIDAYRQILAATPDDPPATLGLDPEGGEAADHPLLELPHIVAHVRTATLEVEDEIAHPLPGAVIGVATAAPGGEDGEAVGCEQLCRVRTGAAGVEACHAVASSVILDRPSSARALRRFSRGRRDQRVINPTRPEVVHSMTRFLIRRLGLSLVTLLLLSVIVFLGGEMLPGNVGRAMLGPFADQRAVDALNHEMGTDRPMLVRYGDWISRFAVGDMGRSYAYRAPVAPFLGTALAHSALLAALAFALVVPLGLLGGVVAALNVGRPVDRVLTVTGLSAAIVPEFVSGIVLILLFGVWLRWLPISATWPTGAGVPIQLYHLLLPALTLVLILFGYIARMARAGMIEALDADYTRTATLKGLKRSTVIWRHVLRNALLPTISVIATQTAYLIGGLVVIETLFHYEGIGSLIYVAAKKKDFPMLEAGVLVVGVVFTLATLIADLLYATLNPRIRFGGRA